MAKAPQQSNTQLGISEQTAREFKRIAEQEEKAATECWNDGEYDSAADHFERAANTLRKYAVHVQAPSQAQIIKRKADELFAKLGINDPLLDIAKRLEEAALKDDYFISRKLYPNVDFYSGIILRAIGIPLKMFPVMFAIGRMPGWIAHWKEMIEDPTSKIGRPFQIYTGSTLRDYVPITKR